MKIIRFHICISIKLHSKVLYFNNKSIGKGNEKI
jgi:hypothetical protein